MKNLIFLFLLMILFLSPTNASSNSIPEDEPTRIWEGKSYAETLVEYFRRTHPDIPVVFDLADLLDFKQPDSKSYSLEKVKAELAKTFEQWKSSHSSLTQRLTEVGRSLLPNSIVNLTWSLEEGNYIYLTQPASEKQEAFLKWILDQPDNSIEPHRLMAKSLELNKGHLFSAWAMAWNTLSNNWPAAAVRNYGSVTRKMVSLTGERNLWSSSAHLVVVPPEERNQGSDVKLTKDGQVQENKNQNRFMRLAITKRGDEFSYLYHRIGVELLAMVTSEFFGNKLAGSKLAQAGAVAEWLKYTKTAGIEVERKKRVINDVLAGRSGEVIYDLFKTGQPTSYRKRTTLDASLYLRPKPLLFGGSYLLDSGRPSIYEGSTIDKKYWDDQITVEELKFRFHYGTRYDSDGLNMVLMLANGDYEQLHRGLVTYLKSNGNDSELNSYLKDHFEGIVADPKIKDVAVDLNLSEELNIDFMKQAWSGYELAEAKERWMRLIQRILIEKGVYKNYRAPLSCLKFYN